MRFYKLRESIYATIIGVYLLPIIVFSNYSIGLMSPAKSWSVLSIGLVLSLAGALLLILLIKRWELALLEERPSNREPMTVAPRVPLYDPSVTEPLRPSTPVEYPKDSKITPLHPIEPSTEQALQEALQNALSKSQKSVEQVNDELRNKHHELKLLQTDHESYRQQIVQLRDEYELMRTTLTEQINQRDSLLAGAQRTVGEQRLLIEEKQHLVTALENKVRDLTYEVKTLLQLNDIHNVSHSSTSIPTTMSHPVLDVFSGAEIDGDWGYDGRTSSSDQHALTPFDASVQLQKCVEIAQKMTGAAHLAGGSSRFKDINVDSHALDLRRLNDSLRNECSGSLMVYSKKEDKILFATNEIKGLLGWNADKFANDFYSLLQQGTEQWSQTISKLNPSEQAQVPLILKTKSGQDILVKCQLGMIPSGLFAQHIVGVLYPA